MLDHTEDGIVACDSLEDLMKAIRPPRPVIIMVQAGAAVDEQIALLRGVMSANDIVIDSNTVFGDGPDGNDAAFSANILRLAHSALFGVLAAAFPFAFWSLHT